ncbi:MAG: hypothetical protein WBW12_16790 [Terriglobales bacterium]
MWGASRWTARFLMLVMLVPAFGPMAMPCAALPAAMHCMRQAVSAQPAMPCHHGMAQSPPSQSDPARASVQAASNCCQSHCCCGATTSEWAQPASNLLFFFNLLIEPARPTQNAELRSTDLSGYDSARAPPRS